MGAPANPIQAHLKQTHKRATRYTTWLQRQLALPELILYLLICSPLMSLHYQIFKDGKCAKESEFPSFDHRPGPMFDMANKARCRAAKVLRALTEMALAPNATNGPFFMLQSLLGDQRDWPLSFWLKARRCLLEMFGGLWRRLVRAWDCWPWLLMNIIDPRYDMEHRRRWAQIFLDANECCLDGMCRKLRKRVKRVEDFFDNVIHRFLMQLFNQAVYTTSFMECLSASYRQWISRSPRAIRVATLAAKHLCHQFNRPYMDVKEKGTGKRGTKKRGRPLTSKKSKRVNGFHVYCGDSARNMAAERRRGSYQPINRQETFDHLTASAKKWKDEDMARKQQCRNQARKQNRDHRIALRTRLLSSATSLGTSSSCGRWSIGDQKWALAKHRLMGAGYFTKKKCSKPLWRMEQMWRSSDAQAWLCNKRQQAGTIVFDEFSIWLERRKRRSASSYAIAAESHEIVHPES